MANYLNKQELTACYAEQNASGHISMLRDVFSATYEPENQRIIFEGLPLYYSLTDEMVNQVIQTSDSTSNSKNYVLEQSIVFRFGIYFQEYLSTSIFKDYHLDAEYNRNFTQPKTPEECEEYKNGTRPDIILHKRNSNNSNELIMEFKPWWSENTSYEKRDRLKLVYFTQGIFNYRIGVFVKINPDGVCMDFYTKGKKVDDADSLSVKYLAVTERNIMRTSQDIMREIDFLFSEYEREVRLAKAKKFLVDDSVKTYLLHSSNFVRWCRGDFVPGDKNAQKSKK